MLPTILSAQLVRLYLLVLGALGAAAYLGGAVTADICSAYASGAVATRGRGAGEARLLPLIVRR